MESKHLKNITRVSLQQEKGFDANAPLSFIQWKQQVLTIPSTEQVYYYNLYVRQWFENNKNKQLSSEFVLRQKYLFLLQQLQIYFTEEEKNTWYNKINFADEKELLTGIPFFAKKLKNIALYYLKLRKKLKNTKVKYNAVGTIPAIEREVYRTLIENFSQQSSELASQIRTHLPSLSSLQKNLVVTIEELYDKSQYFDKSPTSPLSATVNILDQATANFFKTKGLTLSSDGWIFNSFFLPVTSSVETALNQLTGSVFEITDNNLYGSFVQNFLSENKFSLLFEAASATTEIIDINIGVGNNYFFYPYGPNKTISNTPSSSKRAISTPLSSLNILGATAGSSIETSDTMFVKSGNDIQAAWLKFKEFEETEQTVESYINSNTKTSFIFPFPGYGLSAADVEWTGPSLSATEEYIFLDSETRAIVDQAYWSQLLPPDSCKTILLNNTNLAESGSTVSDNSETADKVYIRTAATLNSISLQGNLSAAWFYKFTKTSLPISSSQNNVIIWPYELIDSSLESLPNYLELFEYNKTCKNISVQDLNRTHFIASSSFEFADKIYKLENFKQNSIDALECCWLSSAPITNSNYKYFNQSGATFLFPSGQTSRFIWTGPDTPVNNIFRSVQHQNDCPLVTEASSLSAYNWQKCSCKQVFYSPLGHSGDTFNDYSNYCDFVCEDTTNRLDEFDLSSWEDLNEEKAIDSPKFAWYKTSKNGWGGGSWVRGNGSQSPLILTSGKAYFYRRVGSRGKTETFPSYAILQKFASQPTKWIEAKKNASGTWTSTGKVSKMQIEPGNFIKIDRQQNTTSFLLSSVNVENQSSNRGSIWAISDVVAIDSAAPSTLISWPFDSQNESQSPPIPITSISSLLWWKVVCVQNPSISVQIFSPFIDSPITASTSNNLLTNGASNNSPSNRVYLNQLSFTFTPLVTGTYAVSVLAVDNNQTEYYLTSSTIPLITAIPQFSQNKIDLETTTPTPGFLLEQQLEGWTYPNNEKGARPYWAELHTNKNSATKSKGIYSWGYTNDYIDGYVPYSIAKISPLSLSYGNVIEYERLGQAFWWYQPIQYNNFVGVNQWSKLIYNTNGSSVLSSIFETKQYNQLQVIPTMSASDIVLENRIDGNPTEIFYFALNSFVWSISSKVIQFVESPTPTLFFENIENYEQLSNRFFPTIATVPTLDKIYSQNDVGGFFTPNYLGASQFINKDFVPSLKTTNLSGQFLIEDTNIHVGGRGLSQQDQDTLYSWQENNEWMKESATTGNLAGAVNKQLTKTLQTFIPYQSNDESIDFGLISPKSDQSPWTGSKQDLWNDLDNHPLSFTGVVNVSAWQTKQALKRQSEKQLDVWVSDIFGNQYGLFKNLSGVPISERKSTPGEIWIKTNKQTVENAKNQSLSSTFSQFSNIPTLYNELTADRILNIDCLFETLMIELSTGVIFVDLNYDFENEKITSIFDDTRYVLTTANSFTFDHYWFLPNTKQIQCLFTQQYSNWFIPRIYTFDIETKRFINFFPSITEVSQISSTLTNNLSVSTINEGLISYNETKNQFTVVYNGLEISNDPYFVDFTIKNTNKLFLEQIDIYKNTIPLTAITESPIVLAPYLSAIQIFVDIPFAINVVALNNPTSHTILNNSTQVFVNNSGVFTGTVTTSGIHQINYSVSNSIGSTLYSLTLSAI